MHYKKFQKHYLHIYIANIVIIKHYNLNRPTPLIVAAIKLVFNCI